MVPTSPRSERRAEAPMPAPPPVTERLVVVGYSGSPSSRSAVAWAARTTPLTDRLVIVHATSVPIAVHNGPSAQVAEALGNPTWATMRTVVDELIGRDRADTIVEHGRPDEILRRYGATADMIVVGRRSRRNRLLRRLMASVPCAVVGIDVGG
ncbi:MAG: universal stress protein [Acidimicrobiales bacterium]